MKTMKAVVPVKAMKCLFPMKAMKAPVNARAPKSEALKATVEIPSLVWHAHATKVFAADVRATDTSHQRMHSVA